MKCMRSMTPSLIRPVAPHWGAWIEIPLVSYMVLATASHPTGVRGLKSESGS